MYVGAYLIVLLPSESLMLSLRPKSLDETVSSDLGASSLKGDKSKTLDKGIQVYFLFFLN